MRVGTRETHSRHSYAYPRFENNSIQRLAGTPDGRRLARRRAAAQPGHQINWGLWERGFILRIRRSRNTGLAVWNSKSHSERPTENLFAVIIVLGNFFNGTWSRNSRQMAILSKKIALIPGEAVK